MIFSFEGGRNGRFIVELPDNNNKTQEYLCGFDVCQNAGCGCRVAHLYFGPAEGDERSKGLENHARLNIDLGKREIDSTFKKKAKKRELEFGRRLLNAMDEDDYELLNSLHTIHKERLTQKAKACEIDAFFDFGAIEKSAQMPIYNDVLPFCERLRVKIDFQENVLFDMYCVKAKCNCSDAFIEVKPIIDIRGNVASPKIPNTVVSVDYKTRKWTMEERIEAYDLATIRTMAEEQIPDFYQKLSQRHTRIRSIYTHCRKKHLATLPPEPKIKKIGRNDPCPCGSGKKYKKCCLN